MAFDSLPALGAAMNAIFLLVAVYIYVSLIRQIRARVLEISTPDARTFGLPEAILGLALATWFGLNISAASSQSVSNMNTRELLANALLSIGLLLFVAAFLKLRRLDIDSLGGFSHVGFARAVGTGMVLLLAAYPLILVADLFTQRFIGGNEKQGIIELFTSSSTLEQRVLIIMLAIVVAPIAEEFLFRFFLYGVLKRYFGREIGLVANALLFAAAHAHLPSFAPLFVLGSCFTIAYEWSGSLLVSMTMHACFNAISLTALAFPELFPQ